MKEDQRYSDHKSCNGYKIESILNQSIHQQIQGSLASVVFWSPANCTIGKTVLNGYWVSSKINIWDLWIFIVPFFDHFHYCNLTRFFWFELSLVKLNLNASPMAHFILDYQFKRILISFWKKKFEKCWKTYWKKN